MNAFTSVQEARVGLSKMLEQARSGQLHQVLNLSADAPAPRVRAALAELRNRLRSETIQSDPGTRWAASRILGLLEGADPGGTVTADERAVHTSRVASALEAASVDSASVPVVTWERARHPRTINLVQRAVQLRKSGDLDGAIQCLRQVWEPDDHETRLQLGLMLLEQVTNPREEDVTEARTLLEAARTDRPWDARTPYAMARYYAKLGRRDKARNELLASLRCDPQFEPAARALAKLEATTPTPSAPTPKQRRFAQAFRTITRPRNASSEHGPS